MSSNSKKNREIENKMRQEIDKKQHALDNAHLLGKNSVMSELNKYYHDKGIAAMKFDCKSKESCMDGSRRFLSPREASIGTRYDKYILPRVLFIAADPADDWPDPEPYKRTLDNMQREHETKYACLPGSMGPSPVWRKSHIFAYETLKGIAPNWGITLTSPDDHYKGTEHICKYFAFTDSGKCKYYYPESQKTQKYRESKQGPDFLFKNCSQYMIEEVRILRPDIIFTWGDPARDSIQGIPVSNTVPYPDNPIYKYDVLNIKGRKVYRFTLPQPNRVDEFNKQERAGIFKWYFAEVEKFLQLWKQSDEGRAEFEHEVEQEEERKKEEKRMKEQKKSQMIKDIYG